MFWCWKVRDRFGESKPNQTRFNKYLTHQMCCEDWPLALSADRQHLKCAVTKLRFREISTYVLCLQHKLTIFLEANCELC